MKRSASNIDGDGDASKSRRQPQNRYSGAIVVPKTSVDEVDKIDRQRFFTEYIEKRRPLKFRANSENCPIDIGKFSTDDIVTTLDGDIVLQVERKHASGFGLGQKREMMSFRDIVAKLAGGDDSYYLTTQYDEHEYNDGDSDADSEGEPAGDNDIPGDSDSEFGDFTGKDDFEELKDDFDDLEEDEGEEYAVQELKMSVEEAQSRVSTLVQPPLTTLLHDTEFPVCPDLFADLIPQQVNLWMGAAKPAQSMAALLLDCTKEKLGRTVPEGNSSGLHHDHADNLYVLAQGKKRFTLYSPRDAGALYTVGRIRQVFPNGLIDYHSDERARFWRQMRQDGAMLADWSRWRLEKDGEKLDDATRRSLEDIIADDDRLHDTQMKTETEVRGAADPPSFSEVPPLLAHLDELPSADAAVLEEFAEKHFPGFLLLHKMEVWLSPGEMLYLPTGWFHEVTSYAGAQSRAHVAINWWFVPPALENGKVYLDEYWAEDHARTLAAVEYYRDHGEA